MRPTCSTIVAAALCTLAMPVPAAEPEPAAREVTNSIGMQFVYVAPEGHKAFHIGKHEVTQQQYLRVMGVNPSVFSSTGKLRERVSGMETNSFPVDSVSWHDAKEFCRRLSELPAERTLERRYRLPTSAEWELAARAGTTSPWHFGTEAKHLDHYAWYGHERAGLRTHAVGEKRPNGWGLFDVYGNVWEWCEDAEPAQAVAEATRSRVIRGGGWLSPSYRCNSVVWLSDPPEAADPDSGLRVVLD